jgi:hypothetical protein
MSYASLDVSQQESSPVLLYQFVRGSTTWRYCALPTAFVAGSGNGYTWSPEVIQCSNLTQSGEMPRDSITITVPITNAMAVAFLSYAPDEVTTVTIFRTHYDDPTNGITAWKGRVASSSTTVATITLTCELVFVSLRRMGLGPVYQRLCRHVFGGPGCNVDIAALGAQALMTGVTGSVVSFSGLASSYIGGTLAIPDGSLRKIIDQGTVGETAYVKLIKPSVPLQTAMEANPLGLMVFLYPGCNRSTTACRTFYNLGNFGGFPGIPYINPMTYVSSVF